LFELLALKKPNLLIPLSRKVSRGDQILNAESFQNQGYSLVLPEEELSRKALLRQVQRLYDQRNQFIDAMAGKSEDAALHQVLAVISEMMEPTKIK
jgi:UDP-N-acetylglucosamine--N-acetylmuramyl-(pentapeptide) pyrophosphoryl-undecaprenol N-acetylglucosamine transferase